MRVLGYSCLMGRAGVHALERPLVILALAALVSFPPSGHAATKSQYISSCTSACISQGRSSKLPLSSSEKMFLGAFMPSYLQTIAAVQPTSSSALTRKACPCMAKRLAARKQNFTTPNSEGAMRSALKSCI